MLLFVHRLSNFSDRFVDTTVLSTGVVLRPAVTSSHLTAAISVLDNRSTSGREYDTCSQQEGEGASVWLWMTPPGVIDLSLASFSWSAAFRLPCSAIVAVPT